jgi:mannan endo-1,4-beta-mannosidase
MPSGHPPTSQSTQGDQPRDRLSTARIKGHVIQKRAETHKRNREQKNHDTTLDENGTPIRGRSALAHIRRQDHSAFDGSHGVDTEDILAIPQIDFSTFQMFPDQFQYVPNDPNIPSFNNTVQGGLEWIMKQAQTARRYGTLPGFAIQHVANLSLVL